MDEHKLLRDADAKARAQSLLENDMLKEAFDTLERAYTEELFLTNAMDSLGREKLFLAVNVVRKVRDHLTVVISNGKLAERELADFAKRPKVRAV